VFSRQPPGDRYGRDHPSDGPEVNAFGLPGTAASNDEENRGTQRETDRKQATIEANRLHRHKRIDVIVRNRAAQVNHLARCAVLALR